jgi:hypothetical protein
LQNYLAREIGVCSMVLSDKDNQEGINQYGMFLIGKAFLQFI